MILVEELMDATWASYEPRYSTIGTSICSLGILGL